jgi:hypothetical protein
MPAALAREQLAIERVVVLAEEHAIAPVAALRDMVGRTGDNEPGDAGHCDPQAQSHGIFT